MPGAVRAGCQSRSTGDTRIDRHPRPGRCRAGPRRHCRLFPVFREGHAVQYFYEPFLQAFDPELDKELGVWYTPEEIVRYPVERVDQVLRAELDIADGLADARVGSCSIPAAAAAPICEPCCGGSQPRAGKGGVTMPGKGRLAPCGNDAWDAILNDVCCWRNVPKPVWECTIGGYQVIKKWLSYREKELLGRGLTPEEVRCVTEMVRRIAALIALQPALEENYRCVSR